MSTNAREQNQRAMHKDANTTGNLSGGVFPRQLFDEFFQAVQEESVLLDRVRTIALDRHQERIPQIGVGERLMTSQSEDTAVATADFEKANTGEIDIDVTKTVLPWELSSEAVEDTTDDIADILLSKYEQQFAADAQELGVRGKESNGLEYASSDQSFFEINDGWLAIAEGDDSSDRIKGGSNSTMPTYDHQSGGVNTTLFDETILNIEQKYLRTDPVFMTSRKNVQRYKSFLTGKESGYGDAVLTGDAELTPFDHDIVGVFGFPDDIGMFTAPENLIWALRRDVELDVVENSDETLERDLFARYALRARHDYQIEDLNAGVVMKNIR